MQFLIWSNIIRMWSASQCKSVKFIQLMCIKLNYKYILYTCARAFINLCMDKKSCILRYIIMFNTSYIIKHKRKHICSNTFSPSYQFYLFDINEVKNIILSFTHVWEHLRYTCMNKLIKILNMWTFICI